MRKQICSCSSYNEYSYSYSYFSISTYLYVIRTTNHVLRANRLLFLPPALLLHLLLHLLHLYLVIIARTYSLYLRTIHDTAFRDSSALHSAGRAELFSFSSPAYFVLVSRNCPVADVPDWGSPPQRGNGGHRVTSVWVFALA